MSEIELVVKFLEGVANELGYTGTMVGLFFAMFLRNQYKQMQITADTNQLAAKQRSEESKNDNALLNKILDRQTTVLEKNNETMGSILPAFERFGMMINQNTEKQDDILDELRTHESAALARFERYSGEHVTTRTVTQKAIKDSQIEIGKGINFVQENVNSTSKGVQGMQISMARITDKMEKRFDDIEKQLDEIKQLLEQSPDCANKTEIESAVNSISIKLDNIESLIKKDQDNGNTENSPKQ